LPALPKLNTRNPGVRNYIFDVARHWIEFGIDGWRLDVPNEIDDDAFWQEFRSIVKTANPEAYIVGEIWFPAQRWLQGGQFDAVMNYPLTLSILGFFGSHNLVKNHQPGGFPLLALDAPAFRQKVETILDLYDWEVNLAQFNLLDSHDMGRAQWIMGEDLSALRLALLFLITMPGAPCIYYGDEIGLCSDGDPYCRAAFPWQDESSWNKDLLAFYRQAVALRHRFPVLRTGAYRSLYAAGEVFAFHRQWGEVQAVVVFNAGMEGSTVRLSLDLNPVYPFEQVWPEGNPQMITPEPGVLVVNLAPRQAVILVSHP
jgi:cyclomaltodextrinase